MTCEPGQGPAARGGASRGWRTSRRACRATVTASLLLLLAGPSDALEPDFPSWSFNGYGTAGVVRSSEERADFTGNLFAPDGAGHTRRWSPEVDSRLGLQLTADLSRRFSALGQLVVEQNHDETYRPAVEWANVEFDATPNLSLRLGRVVLPMFMASEYRKVGYATPWVRPPQEVYRLLPVTTTDGIGVNHRVRLGGFTSTLTATYGQDDTKTADGGESEARDALTVAGTLERGPTSLFAGVSRAQLTLESLNPVFDAFRSFGPEGEALADRYDVDNKRVEAFAVGARYDPGDWYLMGEWARSKSRTFIGDLEGWYATAGYRHRSLTPYITVARAWANSETSASGLSTSGLSSARAAQATALNTALNELLGATVEQKRLALGTRWDFSHQAALTVQYDYIDLDSGSRGVLTNEQPDFERGGSVSLFSVAVDVVF